jgi:hypothetical protein
VHDVSLSTIFVDGKNAGTLTNPDVEILKSSSNPAPFGKGDQTLFDESVRKAREIEANRI